MRHLTSLPDAVQAANFGDYLTAHGIPNSREEAGGNWAIWVEREDQVDQARAELQQFQQQPGADKYQKATQSARAFEAAQEQLTRRLANNYINYRTQAARGETGVQPTYPATIVLISVCVLVALTSQLGSDYGKIDGFFFLPLHVVLNNSIHGNAFQLIHYFGLQIWLHLRWSQMAVIRQGEYWRLITPIFIHFGFTHLLFDMWWLWDLGKLIERRKGTVFFLILVVVSAVISNLGDFAWSGPNLAGGMSGVVYALFGYVWMKGLLQPQERLGIHQQVVWIMLAWLVLCMTGTLGNIANGAHVFGLIVGVIFGVLPWLWQRLRRRFRSRTFP
jgi:GlpG protein